MLNPGLPPLTPIPPQAPLYHSLYGRRYSRQDMITDIEGVTHREMLVYFATAGSQIEHNDVLGFGDMLHGKSAANIDLLLQSPGGDIDVAEKLVSLLCSRTESLRVIIPESAKNAATLIALASDEIAMNDTSELGPIDPQVIVTTAEGNTIARPVQSFLDGLKSVKEEVEKTGNLSPVYFPMLVSLDLALLDFCQKSIDRSRQFAEKWLKRSQCCDEPKKARKIAKELANTSRYLSHGSVIDHQEAARIGLKIRYYRHDDEFWQRIWGLYCAYETDSREEGFIKIFESARVSLPMLAPDS